MQKPITVSIDTVNSNSTCLYENIRKGDTLSMTIKIFQESASLDLTGQSMHIVLQKPDGYAVEKIINSITGNSFLVSFGIQATLSIGDVEGIIEISDSSGTNITNTFSFKVKENPASTVVENSKNEIETLQQIKALIDSYNANADNLAVQNQLALQHEENLSELNTNGDALADRIEKDIYDGTNVAVRVENDIATGNQLDSNLKQDFTQGTIMHNALLADISNGNDIIQKLPTLNLLIKIKSFLINF